jgi:hypothetical protein
MKVPRPNQESKERVMQHVEGESYLKFAPRNHNGANCKTMTPTDAILEHLNSMLSDLQQDAAAQQINHWIRRFGTIGEIPQ